MTKYDEVQEFLRFNQKTWLITGVAGFIGSNLLEKLLILNQKVVGLDNFEMGYQFNINQAIEDANKNTGKNLSKNFSLIKGDIRNLEDCKKALKNIDYVLHQAALGSVPRSIKDPIKTNNSNIVGFLNILVASKDAKVQNFVYASSSSIYGNHPDLPKVENKIGEPLSPYALSKSVNEKYASIFSKVYNFKSVGLRYFNIFGKRQDPKGAYAAVIPKWILNMKNNENVNIYGDGETTRDFCFIENAVQANLLAAITNNDTAKDQIYNIAVNDKITLNELFYMTQEILYRKNKISKKKPIYCDFREGDVRHSQANINKAKKLLGYDPSYRINEGLEKTIDWFIGFDK